MKIQTSDNNDSFNDDDVDNNNAVQNIFIALVFLSIFLITKTGQMCGNDQFVCKSGSDMSVCISSSMKCDTIQQCYDGEDEEDCRKCKLIPGYMSSLGLFQRKWKLGSMRCSENSVTSDLYLSLKRIYKCMKYGLQPIIVKGLTTVKNEKVDSLQSLP